MPFLPARWPQPGRPVSYLIAAYALVVGTLVAYGWRVQSQRRSASRAADREGRPE